MALRMRRSVMGLAIAGVLLAAGTVGVSAGADGQMLSLHDINGNAVNATISGYNNDCVYWTSTRPWPQRDLNTDPPAFPYDYWWQNWSGVEDGNTCYLSAPPNVYMLNTYGAEIGDPNLPGPPHSQSSDWYSCELDPGVACKAGYQAYG